MNKEKLLKLIKMGESQNLEFTKDAEDVGKTVCSFANTNSGVILVGISDNGKIIGCSDKDEQKVANIAHVCKPSVYPKIEREWIEGEGVIKIYPKFIPNLSQNRKIISIIILCFMIFSTPPLSFHNVKAEDGNAIAINREV